MPVDFGLYSRGIPYLIMDYVEGTPLNRYLKEKKRDPAEIVDLVIQTCDGLFHAHEQGIVHRDIKPGNILVAQDHQGRPQAKLVDFGIAKLLLKEGVDLISLTKTGDIFGSPLYMSPEQCEGVKVDTRTDVYSAAVVLYEGLAGVSPFAGKNSLETIRKHLAGKHKPLSQMVPELPFVNEFDRILFRGLSKSVEGRYEVISEMAEDLSELLRYDGRATGSHKSRSAPKNNVGRSSR